MAGTQNVYPIVKALDGHYQRQQREGKFEPVSCGASTASSGYIDSYSKSMLDDSLGLFDQRYNVADPSGENDWDTKRDLKLIWRARNVMRQGFDATNTIMVDAELRKVRASISSSSTRSRVEGEANERADGCMGGWWVQGA
jgi:hypothetical protein